MENFNKERQLRMGELGSSRWDGPINRTVECQHQLSYNAVPWYPNNRGLIESLITDTINNKYVMSGRVIKRLMDEYQRGCRTQDTYTKFFSRYVQGEGKHRPLSNDALYFLEINHTGDLIPKKYTVGDDKSTLSNLSDNSVVICENHARKLAIYLSKSYDGHRKLEWQNEIIDGNHDWTAIRHLNALLDAKEILGITNNTEGGQVHG